MAINLLGSGNDRVSFGDISSFSGATSLTVAATIRLTAGPASARRIFGQWGSSTLNQCFLLQCDNTDEIAFVVTNGGGTSARFYGKVTTALNIANGSLYRIVAKLAPSANTGAIWVNGTSATITAYLGSNSITTTNSATNVEVGHESNTGTDGLDGDYAEVAAWREYVPDWFCEAYGKGYSPEFYVNNRILYAPLINTAHPNDIWRPVAGTLTNGTDAAHPPMLYRGVPT